MPNFDYRCPEGHIFESTQPPEASSVCCIYPGCQRTAARVWMGRQYATAFDKSETTVVWEHPGTGEVQYPGRNDVPIPKRLQARGFVRRELRSLREVERFEQQHGVRNERAWFDKGSGRSFDNDGRL
jgi:hypothetical protein